MRRVQCVENVPQRFLSGATLSLRLDGTRVTIVKDVRSDKDLSRRLHVN